MNRLRWLTACAALLSAATAPAQFPVPPDVNLFGDDLPQKNIGVRGQAPQGGSFVKHLDKTTKTAPDYAQVLVFRDGRQLHGELLEVTRDEVVWHRADTNEALRFPHAAVRRVALAPIQPQNQNMFPGGGVVVNSLLNGTARGSSRIMPATLKLPGGDWLFGEATTPDGENFALQLDDGTSIPMHRAQLEWLEFAQEPAPAFGFSGSKLDLEGWTAEPSKMEIAGGTVTVTGASSIGHFVSAPKRFEVALEVPADAEDGTRLWLQPFGPQVNCYTTGTVEIQFGKKQITRQLFINRFDRQATPLPREAAGEKGPVNYRVFYDGTTQRVVVLRNGRQVGDWKFESKKDDQANEAQLRAARINGICFDRENRDAKSKLQFNRLRVQPWNGVVPGSVDAAEERDQLTLGDTTPVMGKLESLATKELVFSGETHASKTGVFVKFANAPSALADPEAKVGLGRQGEFSARNLEVHAGHVRCDTAFATALEIPTEAVQTISFPDQPSPPQAPADLLVFKNGDELPGQALAAGTNVPVRWKSFSGQELEFQPKLIAGIRLARRSDAQPASPTATIELRNGERFRGRLVALDEKQLHVQNPQLGALALARTQLWHLFPSAALEVAEGGRDPESWMRNAAAEQRQPSLKQDKGLDPWIYLDGTYILREAGIAMSNNIDDWRGLQREILPNLDRFEVRVEASSPLPAAANLFLRLIGKNNDLTWQATVCYNDVQLVIYGQQNRRPNWREIPLQGKLADLNAHRAIRLFVDTKAGTSDLFINGTLIAHIGQDAGERLKPEGYTIHFQPYPTNSSPCVLSNLWIGPWSGELPRTGSLAEATTALSNGDAAPGAPKAIHDGKLAMEGDLGKFDLPMEKVQEVDFGGAMTPEPTAGRLRLADGTVLNVGEFHWDGHELTAQSATLGALHLPAGAVDELIYDPPPPHAPQNPEPKRVAQKDPPNQNAAP